uniref:Uncharacterized protein n=1 Tax=Knipowitschia caucasica TaxID=637954 RepID=A0AAV2L5N3_KNICA
MQKNELAKQIRSLRDEVKASIEQANNRVSMLEERMASLEEGTNTCSDGVTELEQQDGDTIRIFPDFTQSVARQRAAFGPARQILRQCEGVKYGLLYPARLKITTPDGVQQMFSDPVKATAFAKGLMAP